MTNNIKKAEEILIKNKQNHVVEYMKKIDDNKKEKIAQQVLNIDFEKMNSLYKKTQEEIYTDLEEILPISAINPEKISEEKKKEYISYGENAIKKRKYAVVTMAGGQGTRLRT